MSACAEKFTMEDFSISESVPSSWDLKLTGSSTVIGDWWESFDDSIFTNVLNDFNQSSPDLKNISSRINVAKQMVEDIVAEPEVGKVYTGKVVKIVEFGAFVNFMGARDGLLHVSQISQKRVENVSDVLSEGQEVQVKVLDVDRAGKVKLSMKEV